MDTVLCAILDAGLRRLGAAQAGCSFETLPAPEARAAVARDAAQLLHLVDRSARPQTENETAALARLGSAAGALVAADSAAWTAAWRDYREAFRELEWQTRSNMHRLRGAGPETLGFVLDRERNRWTHCGEIVTLSREEKIVKFQPCEVAVIACRICGVRHEHVVQKITPRAAETAPRERLSAG